jgi:hypothetical protein
MSLFCLVHGSTQGRSGGDLLVSELERRGHETVRADLPTDQPEASATLYADVISASILQVATTRSSLHTLPAAFSFRLCRSAIASARLFSWLQ